MFLVESSFEDCTIIDKITAPDSYGSVSTEWKDGAGIRASIVLDDSMTARIGKQLGAKNVFTITTNKNVVLRFHDVIRRESDKKIFRITSDGDDKVAPKTSTLNIRQVSAEEWELA